MFLARSIRRLKWPVIPEVTMDEISADAITGDLRTRDNSLSFWHSDSADKDDIEDAVLTISSGRDRVEKVELIWLDRVELESAGQDLAQTDGSTPVTDLVDSHVDVCSLNYQRLGGLASLMISAIASDQYQQVTRKQVQRILADAVLQRRLSLGDLNTKIQVEVQQILNDM